MSDMTQDLAQHLASIWTTTSDVRDALTTCRRCVADQLRIMWIRDDDSAAACQRAGIEIGD